MQWRNSKSWLIAAAAVSLGASVAAAQAQRPGAGSTAAAPQFERSINKETFDDQLARAREVRQRLWPRMGSPSGGHPGGADAGKNSVPMEANRYK
jgi:hypothetical protein